jgi:hypothetical protein
MLSLAWWWGITTNGNILTWWGRQTGPEKHNISNKKFTRGSDKLPLTIAADQGKNLISMTVKFLRL